MSSLECLIDRLRGTTMTAFTGAGMSTAAGIPDYRGPQGVWTMNPAAAKLSRVSHYRDDPELRKRIWLDRLANPLYRARPTSGHYRLQGLAHSGQVLGVVTQNVDGLHRLDDSASYPLVEIHGCINETRCLRCGDVAPMTQALTRVFDGDPDPRCQASVGGRRCDGILTSNTVTFGEPVPSEKIEKAQQMIAQANALLVLGSTLSVNPAARLVAYALDSGKLVAVVNQGPTRYDTRGVHKLDIDCQDFLGALESITTQ